MIRPTLIGLIVVIPLLVSAQNLVPNPDFEQMLECPDYINWGDVDDCVSDWTDPNNGSSDYFHACSSTDDIGVPSNNSGWSGYQLAHSGDAYCGFGARSFAPWLNGYREYIHNQLSDSLETGKCYYVEFYVNKTNGVKYAMNVGLLFTDFEIAVNWGAVGFYEATPQIEQHQGALLTDTVNWMRINGSYLAEGGEQYITIGNFDYNYEIDTVRVLPDSDNGWAYYYVEDVVVKLIPDNAGPALAGPDHFILPGDTVQLGNNPLSDAVYRWYPAEGLNDSMLENPLAFPEVTTTYYCIKEACGWESVDSVTVTVQTTGINHAGMESKVSLSPNPNSGNFGVNITPGYSEQLYLDIIDIRGTRVLRKEVPPESQSLLVSAPDLPAGLYFISLVNRAGQLLYSTKLSVVK